MSHTVFNFIDGVCERFFTLGLKNCTFKGFEMSLRACLIFLKECEDFRENVHGAIFFQVVAIN